MAHASNKYKTNNFLAGLIANFRPLKALKKIAIHFLMFDRSYVFRRVPSVAFPIHELLRYQRLNSVEPMPSTLAISFTLQKFHCSLHRMNWIGFVTLLPTEEKNAIYFCHSSSPNELVLPICLYLIRFYRLFKINVDVFFFFHPTLLHIGDVTETKISELKTLIFIHFISERFSHEARF